MNYNKLISLINNINMIKIIFGINRLILTKLSEISPDIPDK